MLAVKEREEPLEGLQHEYGGEPLAAALEDRVHHALQLRVEVHVGLVHRDPLEEILEKLVRLRDAKLGEQHLQACACACMHVACACMLHAWLHASACACTCMPCAPPVYSKLTAQHLQVLDRDVDIVACGLGGAELRPDVVEDVKELFAGRRVGA